MTGSIYDLLHDPRRMNNIQTADGDLTKDFGPSSSGKTILIASTEGNVAVDGHEEAKVGLNVYRKK